MNICFLVELPKGFWQWSDGLYAALKLLEKEHDICYHLDGLLHDHKPDVLFCWGGTLSQTYKQGLGFNGKKALFYAGGPRSKELFSPYDLIYFENKIHLDEVRPWGINCLVAFGTNTKVFKPLKNPKVFDVIYPGAFGRWKRKDLFAASVAGFKAFSCGNIQWHEPEQLESCIEAGVVVSGDLPQDRLPYFMAASHCVCVLPVPEIGCQRTVLEAMAMKLPVIVPEDAPLVREFVEGHGGVIAKPYPNRIMEAIGKCSGRVNEEGYNHVMDKYTEKHYFEQIKKGIERI